MAALASGKSSAGAGASRCKITREDAGGTTATATAAAAGNDVPAAGRRAWRQTQVHRVFFFIISSHLA